MSVGFACHTSADVACRIPMSQTSLRRVRRRRETWQQLRASLPVMAACWEVVLAVMLLRCHVNIALIHFNTVACVDDPFGKFQEVLLEVEQGRCALVG